MGKHIELKASDGHTLGAYRADPVGNPRGGVVILQEIFGLTPSIRGLVNQYAAAGYVAIAPALFDRAEPGLVLPYTDLQRGMGLMKSLDQDKVLLDIEAAVENVVFPGKVAVVGFCWGGLLAYLSATRLKINAAVAYYGGGIQQFLGEKPRAPVLFHYGELDTYITLDIVEQVKAAYPQGIYHLYPANHAFNNVDRPSYDPASAALAFERTQEFLLLHVG